MGQANVKRWIDDILPLLSGDDDPLGVDTFATHHVPLTEAPEAYDMFQKKRMARSRWCSSLSAWQRPRRVAAYTGRASVADSVRRRRAAAASVISARMLISIIFSAASARSAWMWATASRGTVTPKCRM